MDATLAITILALVPNGVLAYVAAALSVVHSAATARAAPPNLSRRRFTSEADLTRVFDMFTRRQSVRASFQALTLLALAVAVVR
jgi:hypothetical protein